jgi:uncharacterized membrane protein
MKPRNLVLAVLPLVFVACSAPPAPPDSVASQSPVPASAPVAAAQEMPAAKRAAGQEHEPLLAWRAFGNEPFWNVRVDGDTLVFTTPDDQSGRTFAGTHALRSDGGVHYEGNDGDKAFRLDIAKGECSDGMSDNVYQLTAEFRYGDMDYKGCAEAAK